MEQLTVPASLRARLAMFYCQGGSVWLRDAEPAAVQHTGIIHPLLTNSNRKVGTKGCKILKLD